jgi:hypothetical protein
MKTTNSQTYDYAVTVKLSHSRMRKGGEKRGRTTKHGYHNTVVWSKLLKFRIGNIQILNKQIIDLNYLTFQL